MGGPGRVHVVDAEQFRTRRNDDRASGAAPYEPRRASTNAARLAWDDLPADAAWPWCGHWPQSVADRCGGAATAESHRLERLFGGGPVHCPCADQLAGEPTSPGNSHRRPEPATGRTA